MIGAPPSPDTQPARAVRWRLALSLVALLAVPTLGAEDATPEAAPGRGSLRGQIFEGDGKIPVVGATVRAVHLDTKESFEGPPTETSGRYEVAGLPYGYYDVVVLTAPGKLFVSNRVLNVPPERKVEATFTLTETLPEEREWWEADPARVVPGVGRRPDGIARLVGDDDRSFWATKKGIAVLAGGGAGAIGLLLAASDDEPTDETASSSVP